MSRFRNLKAQIISGVTDQFVLEVSVEANIGDFPDFVELVEIPTGISSDLQLALLNAVEEGVSYKKVRFLKNVFSREEVQSVQLYTPAASAIVEDQTHKVYGEQKV